MQRDFIKASERISDTNKETIKDKINKVMYKNKKVKYVKPRIIVKNINFIKDELWVIQY